MQTVRDQMCGIGVRTRDRCACARDQCEGAGSVCGRAGSVCVRDLSTSTMLPNGISKKPLVSIGLAMTYCNISQECQTCEGTGTHQCGRDHTAVGSCAAWVAALDLASFDRHMANASAAPLLMPVKSTMSDRSSLTG